jgi:hypothetical protein
LIKPPVPNVDVFEFHPDQIQSLVDRLTRPAGATQRRHIKRARIDNVEVIRKQTDCNDEEQRVTSLRRRLMTQWPFITAGERVSSTVANYQALFATASTVQALERCGVKRITIAEWINEHVSE